MSVSGLALTAVLLSSLTGTAEQEAQFLLRQQYDTSCGFAVTASLLTCWYGYEVSEKTLIDTELEDAEDPNYVISFFAISEILNRYTVASQGFHMDIQKLPQTLQDFGPLICWDNEEEGHFFLLLDIFQEGPDLVYVIGDPSSGIIYADRKEFSRQWSGRILVSAASSRNYPDTQQLRTYYRSFLHTHDALFEFGALR